MMNESELLRERQYTARVQQLLVAAIDSSKESAGDHVSTIKQLLADAWDELRMKTTALSEQDMQQIASEVDVFLARKALDEDLARRYEKMLTEPFFARVDFAEEGSDAPEKIVIGLYSLKAPDGTLMVHDWRAPVCSLYYDALPGQAEYESPDGIIKGELSLKRQYKMENGRLKYYVNTSVSIDDSLLLDILSGATQRHVRQIVATIQSEQNKAIRRGDDKLLCVVGGAGSGKTSVAMHRIAYLMYRYRNRLDAKRILIISPGSSFSEYISSVLPELGEENVAAVTLHSVLEKLLDSKIESPLIQTDKLLDESNTLRRSSVRYKSGTEFLKNIQDCALKFARTGPEFRDISLENSFLARKDELERMYRVDFAALMPAKRIERIRTVLESRLEKWAAELLKAYKTKLKDKYHGKELETAAGFSLSQRLQPVRKEIRRATVISMPHLYAACLYKASDELRTAARENADSRVIWWEDAPCMALLGLLLGFYEPCKDIRQLVVDETQDYTACALAFMNACYPLSHTTLLGDPKQRTCPALPELDVSIWRECFGISDAPILELSRCYRSTLNITRLCNAILPDKEQLLPFGREGDMPEILPLSDESISAAVKKYKDAGISSIAVITRTLAEADRISRFVPCAHLLDGSDEDVLYDPGDVAVGSYHLMKGLEYDAVIVAWPYARLSDGERRRLYTACSRALHKITLLTEPKLIAELGIIL